MADDSQKGGMSDNTNLSPDVEEAPAILRPLKRAAGGPLARTNRRAEKRCRVPLVFCQVLPPALSAGEAAVVDLSARGARLRLEGRVVRGDLLLLRLSNREQLCTHDVTLRVTGSGGAGSLCLTRGVFVNELPLEVFRSLLA
jgi:hypothetical protein